MSAGALNGSKFVLGSEPVSRCSLISLFFLFLKAILMSARTDVYPGN